MASQSERRLDSQTPVSQLKAWMQEFVDERKWQKFHSPKNLAMSIAIEAAELMEHFQWLTDAECNLTNESLEMPEIHDEIADVACYVLSFCNAMNIDLTQAIEQKMAKNREKYPAPAADSDHE